ncbi:CHAT domain-containing protein [Dyadobacter sp. LJ53]|nr:CHAT domain-containing protein [Dyadobacter chenwenxiniae]
MAVREKEFEKASTYYLKLGKLFYDRGNYLPGIAQALAGLRVIEQFKVNNDTLKFNQFSLLSASYSRLPMSDSATFWFTKANDWLKQQPLIAKKIPADVCGHYLNQGLFYGWTGDFGRSTKYLQEALVLSKAVKNIRLESIAYNYLGNSYFRQKNFREADHYYRKALAGYRSGSTDKCWGEIILGNNLRAEGRLSEGITHIRTGQKDYNRIKRGDPAQQDIDFEIQSSNYLAECFRAAKDFNAAEKSYRTCIELHKRSGRLQGEFIAFSWIGLAHIARQRQSLDSALHYADEAINASRYPVAKKKTAFPAVVSEKTLYEALLISAEVKQDKWKKTNSVKQLADAVLAYEESLEAAARLRRNMIPEESKHFHVERVAKSASTAVRLCYEIYTKTKSDQWKSLLFDLTERNRSMVISDLLHEKYRVVKKVPSSIIAVERTLKQRNTELNKQLAASRTKQSTDSLLALLNTVDVQSYNFLDSLEREFSQYYALKYDFKELSLADVVGRLEKNTAYLSYFIDGESLYCIFIHNGKSKVKRMRLPANFPALVMQLRQALVADPVMFAFSGHSQSAALNDILIKPFLRPEKSIRRLIITRDGLLHYLPFEVLEPKDKPEHFLARNYAISYSYSAKLTFDADRQFKGAPKVLGFAPFAGDNVPDSSKLISSLSEVKAWKGVILIDSAATKPSLHKMIGQTDILLLATHAMADVKSPEHSFIALHPDTPDSLLYATEIVNMPLEKLRMVILSACEGHEGSFNKAEGLLSLARAFRIAGCQTILTTSWKAQSESTSEFSKLFHQYLTEGYPTDIALLKTRQQFFTDSRLLKWAHPYYWANFTLIGNSAVIYPPEIAYNPWYYWVVALLFIVFLLLIISRSRAAGPL